MRGRRAADAVPRRVPGAAVLNAAGWDVYDPESLDGRTRYELLTSLVVPRPIGWLGTRSEDGADNLAPFSYFGALSASPMLVGVSIGHRPDGPKDSLANIRATGAFTVSVVDVDHLAAMNATSASSPPGVDEFELAGLEKATGAQVPCPWVASAPAVLECRLEREVDLGGAPNTLVIGRVVHVRVRRDLRRVGETAYVDTVALRPVGRLWGPAYALPGEIAELERPGRRAGETENRGNER